jgi:predicted HTH domain antitoxin
MIIKKEIELPEEIILSLRLDENEVIKEMKKTLAVKYFKERKLSIGQSAEFAEMTEEDFIKYLGSQNISIFNIDDLDELKRDLENA